jgi:ABC-2 type transport system permease protein
MTTTIRHAWFMTVRQLRALFRQPVWIALTLVQPIIWILLYGALFQDLTRLGNFGTSNYYVFLTPGIVVMTTLFSGGWNGMGMLEDIDRGVVDRFLVTPVSRSAIIAGRIVQGALIAVFQSGILIGVGYLRGARFDNPEGLVVLVLAGVLLGAAFGSLSNAMAMVVRKEETVIAAVNFIILPLTFLSSVLMALQNAAGWIRSASAFNPVNWAVEAGRDAVMNHAGATGQLLGPDWGSIASHLAYLAVFALGCGLVAVRAFRAYQRSV